jgi:hypothetical protein
LRELLICWLKQSYTHIGLFSVIHAGWQQELLIDWLKQSSIPIGFFSVIPAGWQEDLLIGWRKQRLTSIGELPATLVRCRLAGRTPHWLA